MTFDVMVLLGIGVVLARCRLLVAPDVPAVRWAIGWTWATVARVVYPTPRRTC